MVATLVSDPTDPLGSANGANDATSLDAGAPSDPAERYRLECVLGRGAFGTVHKAIDTVTWQTVAIKYIDADDAGLIPASVLRECSLLRGFRHPNVVQLLAVRTMETEKLELVFEFVANNLYKFIRENRQSQTFFSKEVLCKYTADVFDGIHALHSRLIIHRDLKPQNFLVGQDGLKICDFELARTHVMQPKPYTHDVITLWYRPPELLLGAPKYGPEVDMWSAGCIFAEMATSFPLFCGDSEIGTLFAIMQILGTPSEQSWPGVSSLPNWLPACPQWMHVGVEHVLEKRADMPQLAVELLQALLQFVPQSRIKARDAKRAAKHLLLMR